MDLSDAALRDRAARECPEWPPHTRCPHCDWQAAQYIALRDAARAENPCVIQGHDTPGPSCPDCLREWREKAEQLTLDLIASEDRGDGWKLQAREARAEQRGLLTLLVAQVNDIANDCEQVATVEIVDAAERRTWLSIAKALRAAAIRSQR